MNKFISRIISCFRVIAHKDCFCHSKCCNTCFDCDTVIVDHAEVTQTKPHRKLPKTPNKKTPIDV